MRKREKTYDEFWVNEWLWQWYSYRCCKSSHSTFDDRMIDGRGGNEGKMGQGGECVCALGRR